MSISTPEIATSAPERPVMRGWLHVAGAFALAGCSPILFTHARTWSQVGWILCYLVGVESMMVTSALFHRVRWSPKQRRAWRRADHSTIFLAIVGTFLAIAGLTMHGTIRTVLMIVIASGAAGGITIRQLALDAPKWANTLPYLIVSWTAVAVMPQIYRGGGALCFALIVAGGVAYSVGAVFYGVKRPRLSPRVFGYHELFHAFTLVGVSLTFAAIFVALG